MERLDLATVIKVSQAVSSEILLDKLLDTLMRAALEHAGAGRGLMILLRGDERRIAAEAITSGDAVTVQLRDETATAAGLPESVLHYVLRTQEMVILDDVAAEHPFSADHLPPRKEASFDTLPTADQSGQAHRGSVPGERARFACLCARSGRGAEAACLASGDFSGEFRSLP